MSTPEPTPAPEPATETVTPEPQTEPESPPEPPKPTETVEFWKRQARENETKLKQAAKRLQDRDDADLSEIDRVKKQAGETAAQLAELQRQNALLSKGIPADLAPPAHDAPADAWATYADQLLAWRGTAPAPSGPRPDPTQGARPLDAQASKDAEFAAYQAEFFNPNRRK